LCRRVPSFRTSRWAGPTTLHNKSKICSRFWQIEFPFAGRQLANAGVLSPMLKTYEAFLTRCRRERCSSFLCSTDRTLGPGGVCKPASQRTQEIGCWILADDPMGRVGRSSVFWHLDIYPTRDAAVADKGQRGVILESLGKVWLMTIEDEPWRSAHGARIAEIEPLAIIEEKEYSAQYMEAVFTPGSARDRSILRYRALQIRQAPKQRIAFYPVGSESPTRFRSDFQGLNGDVAGQRASASTLKTEITSRMIVEGAVRLCRRQADSATRLDTGWC